MGFASTSFTLPTLNSAGVDPRQVHFGSHEMPGWEDAVNEFGTFEGYGLSATVLAYLTQIWTQVKSPLFGNAPQYPISGSGVISAAGFVPTPTIVAAAIDILPVIPPDIDIIYGDLPIYYLGMAGYASVATVSGGFSYGGITFGATASTPFSYKQGPIFINHLNQFFEPPDPNVNGFWWHLKPGVFGVLTLQLNTLENGVTVAYDGQDGYQHFNPLAGGWFTVDGLQGMLDGGGSPPGPAS